MHDEGPLWVPLTVRGPGIPTEAVDGGPLSTLDLSATMLDYAALNRSCASMVRAFIQGLLESGFPNGNTRLITKNIFESESYAPVRKRLKMLLQERPDYVWPIREQVETD